MSLLVRQIGAGSTWQDGGRSGWRRFGVPPGGAFDRESQILANALLGKPLDRPVVEIPVMGGTFDVLERCRVAVTGARASVKSLAGPLPSNAAYLLDAGDTLSLGHATGAARTYLACSSDGGPEPVLGSVGGADVKVGNIIGRAEAYRQWQQTLASGVNSEPRPPTDVRQLAEPPFSLFRGAIRIMKGPQWDLFDPGIEGQSFVLTPRCDRVGLRLEGPPVGQPPELPSEPACPGAIQVTPSGMLLILGPEGPTIGGYPKVAVVIEADLDRLGQAVMGQKLWFEAVTLEQARDLANERRQRIASVLSQLKALA